MSTLSDRLTDQYGLSAEEAQRAAAAIEAHSAAEPPAVPESLRAHGEPSGSPEPPAAAAPPSAGGAARALPPPPAAFEEAQPAPLAFAEPPAPDSERFSELLRRTRRLKPAMEDWGEELY